MHEFLDDQPKTETHSFLHAKIKYQATYIDNFSLHGSLQHSTQSSPLKGIEQE